jgi:hypothetical protein
MSYLHHTYPAPLLDALKRGQHLHMELSAEVIRVLRTDPEVKKLILDKTKAKYDELLRRSKAQT